MKFTKNKDEAMFNFFKSKLIKEVWNTMAKKCINKTMKMVMIKKSYLILKYLNEKHQSEISFKQVMSV